MKLNGADNLLIGVIYRSPSCNLANHDHLRSLMQNASMYFSKNWQLLISLVVLLKVKNVVTDNGT